MVGYIKPYRTRIFCRINRLHVHRSNRQSLEKLQEVYGEATLENGMLIYAKDGMKLCFIMQDDSVISIEYRSTAL